eukprot:Seg2799.1 transcript_id=Seg2799.1/GoldUCD/mRNA.D3Y31 product="hypothetical protein" protein_id=Seg2799.1/GoldUCD/D3Y31
MELAVSLMLIARWSLICYGMKSDGSIITISYRIGIIIYLNCILIIALLTFDRLIATKYPLQFTLILTRRKTRVLLLASTLICINVAVATSFVEFDRFEVTIRRLILPIVSSLGAMFMIVTYSYIFFKISKRRNVGFRGRPTAVNQQYLKMAAIVTFAYVLCFLPPDFIYAFCLECIVNKDYRYHIPNISRNLGLVFTPVVYIFMQKRRRNRFIKLVCCFKRKRRMEIYQMAALALVIENRQPVLDAQI